MRRWSSCWLADGASRPTPRFALRQAGTYVRCTACDPLLCFVFELGAGVVGGGLLAGVGEDPLEHGLGAGCLLGRRLVGGGVVVGDDVGVVGVAAAGHGDVERFAGHAGYCDDVGGVDGGALGAVGGDGVAKLDVLGDVVGGQRHRCSAVGLHD